MGDGAATSARASAVAAGGVVSASTLPGTGVTTPSDAATSNDTPAATSTSTSTSTADTPTDRDPTGDAPTDRALAADAPTRPTPTADAPAGPATSGENARNRMLADTGSDEPVTDAEPPVTVEAAPGATAPASDTAPNGATPLVDAGATQGAAASEAVGGAPTELTTAADLDGPAHTDNRAAAPEPVNTPVNSDRSDVTAAQPASVGIGADAERISIATSQPEPVGLRAEADRTGISSSQPEPADVERADISSSPPAPADAEIAGPPPVPADTEADGDRTETTSPPEPADADHTDVTAPQPEPADTPAAAPPDASDSEPTPADATGDPDRADAEAIDDDPVAHTDAAAVDPEHDREPAPPEPTDAPTGQTDDAPTPRTQEPEAEADAAPVAPPPPPADPEQALAAVGWRLDPRTLREEAPDPAQLRLIRDGLTGKLDTTLDNRGRARLLSLRAVASRILGDLDDALGDARLAVTYAESTGELRRTALARARLAEALRWRGDHAEADRLFAETNSPELPDPLRALLHEHAGRSCYDQGRLTEACLHFERALDLRHGEDAAMNARVEVALDAVAERAAADGFGPAPRRPEEVLGAPRLPVATFDEEQQLWGYANADGEMVIAHRYAEAQPFHEGLAWVRRPEASRWALIDTSGAALIEANNGYRAVGAFSEGLSWVSMDGKGRWMAVDRMNIVRIPPGYEEVRPFRNGLAAVRQNGGWGAVDLTGEVVVPTRYHGLGTPLADGRKVDGFTADGLAVVELAGRRGVVDRAGRVVVTPAYPSVVVHPVAFLVATESGRWGALDRRGEPLIDPVHPGRAAVVAEIDRLLADASPVL
ncbi:WG repeat-containing protein [Micromonospora sp. C32]|uniref:WG repeat-containing protein n=1 Tax=Micromonospora sp. C32 TaxID=2824877 RepID=UPI0027DCB337|nr:WG repeat-containing protein [Micromonospora sp. C32]